MIYAIAPSARNLTPCHRGARLIALGVLVSSLSGCSVLAVADAAVSVAATAVSVTATVVEATVDVAAAGVRAATSSGEQEKGSGKEAEQ